MWIFSETSFVSVVQDVERPGQLVVRARIAADLDLDGLRRYVPDLSPTVSTPERDYPHRAWCSREGLALGMARQIMALSYDNYKAAVAARHWPRERLYAQVWRVMLNAEEKLAMASRDEEPSVWADEPITSTRKRARNRRARTK